MNDFLEPRFLAVCLFLLFIAACLFMAMWVSPDLHIGDGFFREGKQLGAVPTGLAFASDIMPTAAVLYLLGTVALGGLDGVIIFGCAAASPVLMRLWLAGRLPAARGRTFGEMVTRHLPNGPAKRWVAVACLVVVVPLLIGQLQPLGHAAQLIGLSDPFARRLVVILAGGLILACSAIGAARGATMHQIGTAASFLLIAPVMAAMVLLRFDGDIGTLLETAERQQGGTGAYFGTGGIFGEGIAGHLDLLSYAACVLVGAAFLPHIAVRLSGLPDARSARRAASVGAAALCFLISTAMFIGFGIGALVGREELAQEGPFGGVNMALLAMALDGSEAGDVGKLLFFIMCAVFLTILASASVLLLSGSASIVHDLGIGGSADAEPDAQPRQRGGAGPTGHGWPGQLLHPGRGADDRREPAVLARPDLHGDGLDAAAAARLQPGQAADLDSRDQVLRPGDHRDQPGADLLLAAGLEHHSRALPGRRLERMAADFAEPSERADRILDLLGLQPTRTFGTGRQGRSG